MLVDMLLPLGTILVAAVAAFSISAVIGVVIGRLGLLEPHGGRGARAAAPHRARRTDRPVPTRTGREPSGPAR